jgi:hypothetical protein
VKGAVMGEWTDDLLYALLAMSGARRAVKRF